MKSCWGCTTNHKIVPSHCHREFYFFGQIHYRSSSFLAMRHDSSFFRFTWPSDTQIQSLHVTHNIHQIPHIFFSLCDSLSLSLSELISLSFFSFSLLWAGIRRLLQPLLLLLWWFLEVYTPHVFLLVTKACLPLQLPIFLFLSSK